MKDTNILYRMIQDNSQLIQVFNKFAVNNKLTIGNIKHTLNIFEVKGDFKKSKVNFKIIKNRLTLVS
jgi:hypothetical protein